jgi:hypothetical protein
LKESLTAAKGLKFALELKFRAQDQAENVEGCHKFLPVNFQRAWERSAIIFPHKEPDTNSELLPKMTSPVQLLSNQLIDGFYKFRI